MDEQTREKLESVQDGVDEILRILRGDPVDPNKPGLLTRVDRIERPLKAVWLLIVSVVGLLLERGWSFVKGH